jgi:hypothetical protein
VVVRPDLDRNEDFFEENFTFLNRGALLQVSIVLSFQHRILCIEAGSRENRPFGFTGLPGLYPASKGTDDGSVVGTENPVFSTGPSWKSKF